MQLPSVGMWNAEAEFVGVTFHDDGVTRERILSSLAISIYSTGGPAFTVTADSN